MTGPTVDGEVPLYIREQGRNFLIVVEARRGPTGVQPGQILLNSVPGDPSARPDLQIQADRDLGENPTAEVCDRMEPNLGGVPGIFPTSYDPDSQMIADALNDLACRFGIHTFGTGACTNNVFGSPGFVSVATEVQYCTEPAISGELRLPSGETTLTVRVRDQGGGLGDPKQMIVSVTGP